jgi:hypothetical protein
MITSERKKPIFTAYFPHEPPAKQEPQSKSRTEGLLVLILSFSSILVNKKKGKTDRSLSVVCYNAASTKNHEHKDGTIFR